MKISLTLLSIISIIFLAKADFENDPPVPGRYPGLSFGTAECGITIEVIYDLLCDDCAAMHPIFKEFLEKPFLNK